VPIKPFSQFQYRKDQREEIVEHERQVTREMRSHKRDNHKHDDQQHQQFLFHRHDIPRLPIHKEVPGQIPRSAQTDGIC